MKSVNGETRIICKTCHSYYSATCPIIISFKSTMSGKRNRTELVKEDMCMLVSYMLTFLSSLLIIVKLHLSLFHSK